MADTTRTFLAVPLPDDAVSAIGRLRSKLEPEIPGIKWVAPDHYHLTLAFLGDVQNTDLETIGRATEDVTVGFDPLELRVEGLGAFPSSMRLQTLWVGLTGPGIAGLEALREAVAEATTRAGYPPDGRFTPHVTLARFRSRPGRGRAAKAPDVTGVLEREAGWSGGSFEVREVVLFRSILRPEGPQYTPLARGRLGSGKGGTGA